MLCASLSLTNCALFRKEELPPPIDSYCLMYHQLIVKKGDGNIVAPPDVKQRLLANELTYRECPK